MNRPCLKLQPNLTDFKVRYDLLTGLRGSKLNKLASLIFKNGMACSSLALKQGACRSLSIGSQIALAKSSAQTNVVH